MSPPRPFMFLLTREDPDFLPPIPFFSGFTLRAAISIRGDPVMLYLGFYSLWMLPLLRGGMALLSFGPNRILFHVIGLAGSSFFFPRGAQGISL